MNSISCYQETWGGRESPSAGPIACRSGPRSCPQGGLQPGLLLSSHPLLQLPGWGCLHRPPRSHRPHGSHLTPQRGLCCPRTCSSRAPSWSLPASPACPSGLEPPLSDLNWPLTGTPASSWHVPSLPGAFADSLQCSGCSPASLELHGSLQPPSLPSSQEDPTVVPPALCPCKPHPCPVSGSWASDPCELTLGLCFSGWPRGRPPWLSEDQPVSANVC